MVFVGDARALLCARASALGCKRSKYYIDSDRRAVSIKTVERDALSGSYEAAHILAKKLDTNIWEFDRDDLFWKMAVALVHSKKIVGFESLRYPSDFPPLQAYEFGILFLDAEHYGFEKKSAFEMTDNFRDFAVCTNTAAKVAIDTWLVIATRLRVVKDIRRVIGLILWAERAEWAPTVVTKRNKKNKK